MTGEAAAPQLRAPPKAGAQARSSYLSSSKVWYLLADANLDANERNIVMSALAGDFDPQKVAQELSNQFSEYDVKEEGLPAKIPKLPR